MEPNVGAPMPVVENKNNGRGWKITAIAASVLAICGIGFGIFGMANSMQKDNQLSDIKVQFKESSGEITTVDSSEIETKTGDEPTIIIKETTKISGGPYIEDGVFYVPDWGLKFNIPDELANYGFSVDYDEAHVGYSKPSIGFTAMLKTDVQQGAQIRYYDDIETCAIVNVTKETGDWTSRTISGTIKSFDDYTLLIWNYNRHNSCDYNLHIDEVQTKIQNMFSNPEKI